jgi:hypothetical protein
MESFLYKRYILIFHYGDNSQTGRYNFGESLNERFRGIEVKYLPNGTNAGYM